MTTLQAAIPAAVEVPDTLAMQEARWSAWKAKSIASDLITQRRVRMVFTAILITLGVTLAMAL